MGITVARMIIVVVESPPLLLSLVSPFVETVEEVTPIFAMEPPDLRRLLRLLKELVAPTEPGAESEFTSILTVTEPETILRTTMLLAVTPAALAIWLMKAT